MPLTCRTDHCPPLHVAQLASRSLTTAWECVGAIDLLYFMNPQTYKERKLVRTIIHPPVYLPSQLIRDGDGFPWEKLEATFLG